MNRFDIKRVLAVGGSLCVPLPRDWCDANNVTKGTEVVIAHDGKHYQLMIDSHAQDIVNEDENGSEFNIVDDIACFIRERIDIDSENKISHSTIYTAYKEWCRSQDGSVLSNRQFAINMRTAGYLPKRSTGGQLFYFGIRIKGVPIVDEKVNAHNHI